MPDSKAQLFQSIQEQLGPTIDRSRLLADNLTRATQSIGTLASRPVLETPFIVTESAKPVSTTAFEENKSNGYSLNGSRARNEQLQEPNVIASTTILPPSHMFRAIQRWECTVLSVEGNEFTALLRDLDTIRSEEKASFSFEEVYPDDHALIAVGAIFYWYVGYETTKTGQRKLSANIRFRRVSGWTRSQLADVRRKAKEMESLFGKRGGETANTSGPRRV